MNAHLSTLSASVPSSDARADRIAELVSQAEEVDRISREAHERIAYELDTLAADRLAALN